MNQSQFIALYIERSDGDEDLFAVFASDSERPLDMPSTVEASLIMGGERVVRHEFDTLHEIPDVWDNSLEVMTPRETAEVLLLRWPEKMGSNKNVLTDIACPKCGNRASFKINMSSLFDVYDEGTDDHEDTEWSEKSYCRCTECDHEGVVDRFTFLGLDDLIEERKSE